MSRLRPHHLVVITVLALAIASARAIAPPRPTAHTALGQGAPIVLLHGLGSRGEDWLPAARRLARQHRVVIVDLPGHGGSEMPEPFSLARAAAALDRSLAEVPGGPVILVGHSLGGLVATAQTLANPGRVRGLVLVETALRPQLPADQRDAWMEKLERDYDAVLREAYLDFGRDQVQGEALYRRVASFDRRMVQRWIRLAWTADLSQSAKGLTVPVLVVLAERSWGRDEPWPPVAEALGYSDVPGVRATRLADCGHFVMLDHPVELAALIQSFAADPAGTQVVAR